MKAFPLPSQTVIRCMSKGCGRSSVIRRLFAERCSVAEIVSYLRVGRDEVRRTLHRPVFRAKPLRRVA